MTSCFLFKPATLTFCAAVEMLEGADDFACNPSCHLHVVPCQMLPCKDLLILLHQDHYCFIVIAYKIFMVDRNIF